MKDYKKVIIGIIIGGIFASGITAYATYSFFATDISYTRNNTTMSVSSALDQLYTMKDNKYTQQEYTSYGNTKYQEGVTYGTSVGTGENVTWSKGTAIGNIVVSDLNFRPSQVYIYGNCTDNSISYFNIARGTENNCDWLCIHGNASDYYDWSSNFTITDSGFSASMTTGGWLTATYNWIALK